MLKILDKVVKWLLISAGIGLMAMLMMFRRPPVLWLILSLTIYAMFTAIYGYIRNKQGTNIFIQNEKTEDMVMKIKINMRSLAMSSEKGQLALPFFFYLAKSMKRMQQNVDDHKREIEIYKTDVMFGNARFDEPGMKAAQKNHLGGSCR